MDRPVALLSLTLMAVVLCGASSESTPTLSPTPKVWITGPTTPTLTPTPTVRGIPSEKSDTPSALPTATSSPTSTDRPWRSVERILGKKGESLGGSLRLDFPRVDLNIMIEGVALEPELGLVNHLTFTALPQGSQVTGELVLLDREVPKTLSRLISQGFRIDSLHHLFLNESPGVKAVRFSGKGPRIFLAEGLQLALRSTGILRPSTPPAPRPMDRTMQTTPSVTPTAASDLVFAAVERVLGPGRLEGRVLRYSIFREDLGSGREFPPESSIRVQKVGDKVAVSGEWVLSQEELGQALGLFSKKGIQVTALRSEGSGVFYVRYWALGDPAETATGLKALWEKRSTGPVVTPSP